ncbi:MAG TPA: trypsin-like peptidase domain-containing protein [Longimicrobiaceae bacterium]|jgi:serine protease Do|nr:trypsin-like peptidase domain-containing protein [Longimicrobiaceae bacterium]
MNRHVRRIAVPGALVLGLATAATGVEVVRTSLTRASAQTGIPPLPPANAPAPQAGPVGEANSLATAFRTASRTAFPAVVYIRTEAVRTVENRVPQEFRGTPFEQFFGGPGGGQSSQPEVVAGSGFIVSQDGYVLTNNHVVAGANRVTVTLTDKREFSARVVGRDPNTDIAVLKLEGRGFPTVQLGNSDGLQTGDWVLALGYPLSLGETTTAGIVSAKGRSIGIMRENEGATQPLEHFIQTDAVINPGNSGGPLIDLQGHVVGINSAIASPTGYYNGYGFAVPISLAKRVADDLIRYGTVHRPMIGVQIHDVSSADKEVFKLDAAAGTVVAGEPTGPARDAGLKLGDVIVGVDGARIDDTGDLMERVARKQPGDDVVLDIVRYGDRQRLTVKLSAMQAQPVTQAGTARKQPVSAGTKLGFRTERIDDATARQNGLPAGGLVVTDVDRGSPAWPVIKAGLRIESVNGVAVSTPGSVESAAARIQPGQAVSIVARTPDEQKVIINYRVPN